MGRAREVVAAVRRWLRVVASPPWRRAPLQAPRSPALAIGVAVAAVVLGLAGASRALFSASAGRASLLQDLDEGCPAEVGLRVERGVPLDAPGDPVAPGTAVLDDAVAPVEGIGPVVATRFGGEATVAVSGGSATAPAEVQLRQRDGSADHVELLSGGEGPGVWLTDTVAEPLGLAPGDEVEIGGGGGPTATLPVAAVHRDLRGERDSWWCSLRYTFEARSAGGASPPPVVLFDGIDLPGTVASLGAGGMVVW